MIIVGWLTTTWHQGKVDAEMRDRLLHQAMEIASTINPDRVKAISFTAADRGKPVFERLRGEMTAYGLFIRQRSIYSMISRDGTIIFGPENLAENDPMASPPGTVYVEPPRQLRLVFATKRAETVGPFTDEYGTFVSSFAPVIDPHSGEVLMVIGLDIPANEWRESLAASRRHPILGMILLGLIILSGLVVLEWRDRLPPLRLGRFRHVETLFTAAFCLVLTSAVSLLVLDAENRERRRTFDRQADSHARMLHEEFSRIRDNFSTIAGFIEGNSRISTEEFRNFVGPLTRNSTVQSYGWAQRVQNSERVIVERDARAEGNPDFRIKDEVTPGKIIPAPERSEYFVVRDIEPRENYLSLLGLDLYVQANLRAELERAIQTGLPVSSPLIPLPWAMPTTKSGSGQGVVVFQPVFARTDQDLPEGNEKVRDRFRGFVVGVIDPRITVARSISRDAHLASDISVDLFDLSRLDERVLLATTQELENPPIRDARPRASISIDFSFVSPLFHFGRAYAVVACPGQSFFTSRPAMGHRVTGAAGLLLTLIMTAFVGFVRRHQAVLENLVLERTRALQERETDLAITLNSIGDAVMATDIDGRVVRMNPVAESLTGWSAEESLGKLITGIMRIISAATGLPAEDPIRLTIATGRITGLANGTILKARDGSERPIADSAAPIKDAEGRLRGAVVVFHDITAQQSTRKALQESEERFRTVVAVARDAIVMLGSQGEITLWSPGAETMFGWLAEEVMGKSVHQVLAPAEYHQRFTEAFPVFQQSGKGGAVGRTLELEARHKLGHQFPVELSLSGFQMHNQWLAVAVLRDIT
jgi:PAS domain S-box-containing protein